MFRSVFIAVLVSGALIVAAFVLNSARPDVEVEQPSAAMVRATGKCAECHRRETGAVVAEFEKSAHAKKGVTCLDCHRVAEGQTAMDHRGFEISEHLTSKNCAQCHAEQIEQYMRSRHAAPAWAAVRGREAFTEEQIAHAEQYHPGAVDRPANKLAVLEGEAAIRAGCEGCHDVGRPNPDGSIGTCTDCHTRHLASVALARTPQTCGQCHLGPDHSQIEIYQQSKHGALFTLQKTELNLDADPKKLTTDDMPVPTCATCHMSGLGGQKVTHDTTERLSYFLFAAVSEKRDGYARNKANMQAICTQCHTSKNIEAFYELAESVVASTNAKVKSAKVIVDDLRKQGKLTPEPFDEPIEFVYFDLWHYFGRTAKHGAYMGGADYVQWHGNYELLYKTVELREMAKEHGHEENGHAE